MTTETAEARASPTKLTQRAVTEQRADFVFAIYYGMGPERSLERVAAFGAEMGLRWVPSLKTVKRWSAHYGWQRRVAEMDEKIASRREDAQLSAIEEMNRRQALVGSALQQVGARIVNLRLTGDAGAEALLREASLHEAARLVDVGAKLERLSRGAVTERQEIIVSVWTTVVNEIAAIFLQINALDDPELRKREFASSVDDLIERHAAAALIAGGAS